MGKSRILAAFTIMIDKAYKKDLDGIYIAFSSQILLETDKIMYKKLENMLKTPIHLSVGFDKKIKEMGKKDLLILDETDWHVLDALVDIPKCYGVFGVTATHVGKEGGNEQARMEQLRMWPVFDSHIDASFDPETELEVLTAEKFFDHDRSSRAKLIWCRDDQVELFTAQAGKLGYEVKVNHEVIGDLRKLKDCDCVIISQLHLTRGVDYRCVPQGIDMMLCRDFPSTRSYHQGLNRVGRYSNPSERLRYAEFKDAFVNKDEEVAIRGKIGAKVDSSK